jgi:hypothetical protein
VLAPLVGLALYEAAHKTWPDVAFNLKAPNDLYVHDKKIAGILIEAVLGGPSGRDIRVVVGLGFNVLSAPSEISHATCLKAHLVEPRHPNSVQSEFTGSVRPESAHADSLRTEPLQAASLQIDLADHAQKSPCPHQISLETSWPQFLSTLKVNFDSAVLAGQSEELDAHACERLKEALNKHPLLAEPVLQVNSRGELHSASRTIHWHEL